MSMHVDISNYTMEGVFQYLTSLLTQFDSKEDVNCIGITLNEQTGLKRRKSYYERLINWKRKRLYIIYIYI